MTDTNKYQELFMKAKEASENAYCPYSNFKVGASALYESGNVYLGCNVENASYGVGLCAERNALSSAIANGEKTNLIAVAIYSPNQQRCLPCGACLQWLSEFKHNSGSGYDIKVIVEDTKGDVNKTGITAYSISELLPFDFKFDK